MPPCAAAPPSAADTSLLPAVHAAAASSVLPTPATSAPLPPALDGVAAASGVAQGAGCGEETLRAEASAGNGTQVTKAHATAAQSAAPASGAASPLCAAAISAGAHSSAAAIFAGLTPSLANAFAGVAGAGADVNSAAGTAVRPISYASHVGDHSPSQINPPQSQATAEGRFPDMSQCARVEERERRLNELRETYHRKKRELDLEYLKALEQLEQEYSDLPSLF